MKKSGNENRKTEKGPRRTRKTARSSGATFFENYRTVIVTVALIAVLLALGYLLYAGLIKGKILRPGGAEELPFRDEVAKAERDYGVEMARIYAVIRVESDFVPDACSSHGALGLMQMLPSTYEDQCAAHGVPYDPEDLKKPDVNIDVCTGYLSKMYAKTGDWRWAHIAYYAGIGNVLNWQKEGIKPEEVPMESARKYLEKINSAYSDYKAMFAAAKNTQDT